MLLRVVLSGLFVLFISCRQLQKPKQMGTESIYQEGFIQGNEFKLQYLDWGGSGQPLILGLGDSPFLFEDLAASLTTNFRIIAYARRGHCKSVTSDADYSNSTLVSDLKLLLDSLKIDKASLLGWSMGGNEITEFAIRYPERVNKLIYFEAGYDLSDVSFRDIMKTLPKSFLADNSDLRNLAAYRNWYHKFWFADMDWNSALEANLKATIKINPDSSVTTIPNDSIFKATLESAMSYHRDYSKIQSPALAIFTRKFFVPPVTDSNIVSVYDDMERRIIDPWRLSSMTQMKRELKNLSIKELTLGSHVSFIFLSRDPLVETMTAFLLNE